MVCELVYAGPTEDFCQKWVFQRGEKKTLKKEKQQKREKEEGEEKKKLIPLAI